MATANPITLNGLKIKWADIDPNTLNIDLEDVRRKLSEHTKLIIFVNWGGCPNDLDKLEQIRVECLNKFGFKPMVIQDGAHSFGATYKGKKLGTFGNIITFYSLQAIKLLNSSDGGILLSPYKELIERGRLARWFGLPRDTERSELRCNTNVAQEGFKFHLTDFNAAVGVENLKHINGLLAQVRENSEYYNKVFAAGIAGVTPLHFLSFSNPSYWIYTIKVERRDDFESMMKSKGIAVSRVHHRLDQHDCFKQFRSDLPNLESIMPNYVAIPNGWWVTKEDREYIVEVIKGGW
jgi:dTDP-4-amino-4,6-dideoxygalactose transaminase